MASFLFCVLMPSRFKNTQKKNLQYAICSHSLRLAYKSVFMILRARKVFCRSFASAEKLKNTIACMCFLSNYYVKIVGFFVRPFLSSQKEIDSRPCWLSDSQLSGDSIIICLRVSSLGKMYTYGLILIAFLLVFSRLPHSAYGYR